LFLIAFVFVMMVDVDPRSAKPSGGPLARDDDLQRLLDRECMRAASGNTQNAMFAGLARGRPAELEPAHVPRREIDLPPVQQPLGPLLVEIERHVERLWRGAMVAHCGAQVEHDPICHRRGWNQGQA
jgi:hypothetical protein